MRLRAALALVVLATLLAPAATARPLAPLAWSVAGFIDHQPPYGDGAPPADGTPLASISCPAASLCMAGDAFGKIETSSDPAAGPASWHIVHTGAAIVPLSSGIAGVSCPSVSLCVALDPAGNVLTSTNPAGRGATWTVARVEGTSKQAVLRTPMLTALSCPSASLCVAGDRNRDIITSTDPLHGHWRVVDTGIDTGFVGITAVSCPTTRLCAAADGSGHLITSTNPTGDASSWRVQITSPGGLYGISCPSAALCVAVGSSAVWWSTNPTGGAAGWHSAVVDSNGIGSMDAVTCPSTSLCVAGDRSGNLITSTNPTGGASAWRVDAVDPASSFAGGIPPLSGVTAVSCPSVSWCVAVDSIGNALRSSNPVGGASAWRIEQIDGRNAPDGLACLPAGCVAVDGAGNVLTSARPTDPSSWTVSAVDDRAGQPGGPGAVSCPSAAFCAAVDGDANVLAAANPLTGSLWRATRADPGHALASVSCPSSTLCVAADDAGNAAVSSNPADPSATWTVSHVDQDVTVNGAQAALTDVSCPSVFLCVATDNAGNVLSTTDPAGGAATWTATAVDEGTALETVSCPSTSFCVAAGGATILVSTAPAAYNAPWTVGAIPGPPADPGIQRISCTGTLLCVGTDQNGDVLSTDDPGGGGSTWRTTNVESYGIPVATCAQSAWCIAIDGVGNLLTGAQPPLRDLLSGPLVSAALPGRAARQIDSLLTHGGYRLTLAPPVPGRVSVIWRLGSRRVTLASGGLAFAEASPQTLEVALTRAGRRLLRRSKRVRVTATVTFTAAGASPVVVVKRFTLTGKKLK